MTKKSKKINKKVDIDFSELDMKKAKAKLSMWIDGDVLAAVRAQTQLNTGSAKGYQTYLNKKLREIFLHERTEVNIQQIEAIEHRLYILEKAMTTNS